MASFCFSLVNRKEDPCVFFKLYLGSGRLVYLIRRIQFKVNSVDAHFFSFLCFRQALIPPLCSLSICFIVSVIWVSIPSPEGQGAIRKVWHPVVDSTAYLLQRDKAMPTSLPLKMCGLYFNSIKFWRKKAR